MAALTAYVTDRKTRTEIEHLLGLLLSQGRAVGISLIAAIQDPSKDTLPGTTAVHRTHRAATDRSQPNRDGARSGRP